MYQQQQDGSVVPLEKRGRDERTGGNEGELKRSQVGAAWVEMGREKPPMVDGGCVGAKYKRMAHAHQRQVDAE